MAEGASDDAERSEEPTQKKLDDARKKGDVAKSQEVNTWFMLAAGGLVLAMFAPGSAHDLAMSMRGVFEHAHRISMEPGGAVRFGREAALAGLAALALPLIVFMVAGALGNLVQHGLLWTTEPVKPKLSKISPMAGFKRIFSKQSFVTFLKGIFKIVLVGGVVTAVVWPDRERLAMTAAMDVATLAPLAREMTLSVFGAVVAVLAVLAAADYIFQRQTWHEKQRMSVRELKEEYKQQEGDPLIKARIRQLRHERARRRMMAEVPAATVVITNPTHYAVALKYETGMGAPVCVAKGADAVALRIREVAAEHSVPVVENPPLARALFATVEIDGTIPAEHYKAVAEVIGYVYGIRRKGAGWRG